MMELSRLKVVEWKLALESSVERDEHGEEPLDAVALRDTATRLIEEMEEALEADKEAWQND